MQIYTAASVCIHYPSPTASNGLRTQLCGWYYASCEFSRPHILVDVVGVELVHEFNCAVLGSVALLVVAQIGHGSIRCCWISVLATGGYTLTTAEPPRLQSAVVITQQ